MKKKKKKATREQLDWKESWQGAKASPTCHLLLGWSPLLRLMSQCRREESKAIVAWLCWGDSEHGSGHGLTLGGWLSPRALPQGQDLPAVPLSASWWELLLIPGMNKVINTKTRPAPSLLRYVIIQPGSDRMKRGQVSLRDRSKVTKIHYTWVGAWKVTGSGRCS